MRWLGLVAAAAFLASSCFLGTALADTRVALLIGNARYSAVASLTNPPNDVAAIARALQTAGFSTVQVNGDLTRDGMVKAFRAFENQAATADIAVIYYSGHGIEMNGVNYLVPVDAALLSDRDVEDETVSLDRALHAIEGARRLKLVILDACRNNPFLPKMARTSGTRAVSRGLARVEPSTVNTLIAFSAKAGALALDGDGGYSPFAAALADHIVEPGVDIRIALGKVRDDVMASTGNAQEPFINGSLGGATLALFEAPVAPAAARPDLPRLASPEPTGIDPRVAEAGLIWPHLASSNDLDSLRLFKQRYAGTIYESMANTRIEQLKAVAVIAPPPSLPVPSANRPVPPYCSGAAADFSAASARNTRERYGEHLKAFGRCAFAAKARLAIELLGDPPNCAGAAADWAVTTANNKRARYGQHLRKFGRCEFASQARQAIAAIDTR